MVYRADRQKKIPYLRKILRWAITEIQAIFSVLDRPFLWQTRMPHWPPIFIIGVPRSGTTLFYQLMTHSFHIAYLPNIANTFYGCPIVATTFGRRLCPSYRSRFQSTFGYEAGCLAPSEAGNLWNRWFPHEGKEGFNYTPSGYLKERDIRDIRGVVANMEKLFQAPFVSKNVKMSVRIPALHDVFPQAIFLVVHREPWHTAVSLLRMRRKNRLDWWSTMPQEMDKLWQMPDFEQVCYQIYYIEKNMERDIAAYFPQNVWQIHYQEVCQAPEEVVHQVQNFLKEKGIPMKQKEKELSLKFNFSVPQPDDWVSDEDIRRIKALLEKFYVKNRK